MTRRVSSEPNETVPAPHDEREAATAQDAAAAQSVSSPPADAELEHNLLEGLPAVARLALAYAPRASRLDTLALFALDARLANLLRHSREPMLAQLRMSWWRETLAREHTEWPAGEPLLAALARWQGGHRGMGALVDGWEALTAPAPLDEGAFEAMAQGRGVAFATLARALGRPHEAEAAHLLGRQWALSDLAVRLRNPQERETVGGLAHEAAQLRTPRVSRALRPLGVVTALSLRRLEKGEEDAALSPMAMLRAMRVGLTGR